MADFKDENQTHHNPDVRTEPELGGMKEAKLHA